MEPDHSGFISLIKQYYPNIVIVGNKKTFEVIEGFYGVGGERYVVGEGDFLAFKPPTAFFIDSNGSLARNDGYF